MYDNGIYKRDQNKQVRTIVNETLEDLEIGFTKVRATAILDLLATKTYVSIKDFDKDANILNLNNGLFNIETETLTEHRPNYLSFKRIPIEYKPDIICPDIDVFLMEVFHKEDINLIYEMTGLCLIPDMTFQKAFLLYGTGNNGKTTFFTILEKLIGEDNLSNVDLSDLNNPFLFATIENKLLNVVSDIDSSRKLTIRTFKQYVGNELFLTINKKYRDPYQIHPTAKLIYSCNTTFPPIPTDTDKGFFRKWITIECPNEFDSKEEKNILERLLVPNELSGFFNKAIQGLKRLMKRGRFEEKYNNWEDIKELWLIKENVLVEFVKDRCIVGEYEYAEKEPTLKALNQWLSEKGKKPITLTKLTQLITMSLEFQHIRKEFKGKRQFIYHGFSLEEEINLKNIIPSKEKIHADYADSERF